MVSVALDFAQHGGETTQGISSDYIGEFFTLSRTATLTHLRFKNPNFPATYGGSLAVFVASTRVQVAVLSGVASGTAVAVGWVQLDVGDVELQGGVEYYIGAADMVIASTPRAAAGHTHAGTGITATLSSTNYQRLNSDGSGYTAMGTDKEFGLGVVASFNDAPGAPGAFTTPTSGEVVNTTDLVEVGAASDPNADALTYDFDLSLNNGSSYTAKRVKAAGTSFTYDYTAEASTTTAKWRARAWDGTAYGPYVYSSNFTIQHNLAPNPATWVSPAAGSTLNRAISQRLDYDFNDPDIGDAQTKRDQRIRLVGAGSWTTTLGVVTGLTYWDLTASSLAAGNYEAQVLTYDSQGVAATGWSSSLLFTMADAPGAPVITSPVSGATIPASTGVVAWSIATQQAFQVRKVADSAGTADTTTVYYDSGEITSTTARDQALTFPVNNRYEHLQVRVKASGLWSSWASIRVLVSYTPPATPTLVMAAVNTTGGGGTDALQITATHPTPGAGVPAVTSMNVDIRPVGTETWTLIAEGVAPSTVVTYYTPASGAEYEAMVTARADNGTTASSVPTA